jgi:hypothetical protein
LTLVDLSRPKSRRFAGKMQMFKDLAAEANKRITSAITCQSDADSDRLRSDPFPPSDRPGEVRYEWKRKLERVRNSRRITQFQCPKYSVI